MREYSTGNLTITYPEATCWLYDNLPIQVSSTNGDPVGADIVVTNAASGKYRKLSYISELSTLTFSLNDTFLSLYSGRKYNVVVKPKISGVSAPQLAFDVDMLEGRTLPFRTHGSTRTVYIYREDDLGKIEFLFPATGALSTPCGTVNVTYGGYKAVNLSGCDLQPGTYNLCFDAGGKGGGDMDGVLNIVNVYDITPFAGCAALEWKDTSGDIPQNKSKGGGVYKDEEIDYNDYCITLQYDNVCDDGYNFFLVRYLDTDGLVRYLGGKVIEETTESKGSNFYSLDAQTPFNKLSKRFITEAVKTVKIGYGELRRDSYWSDILLSPRVEFLDVQGNWRECSVKTNKVAVTSGEEDDVELEYQIYNY